MCSIKILFVKKYKNPYFYKSVISKFPLYFMLHIPSPSPETPRFLCYSYYISLILLINTIQIVFIVVQSSHKLLHKVKISIFQIIQAIRQKQKGCIIMANIGVFDVLGPIMIGPSSSHTAGAARLGKIARTIVNKPIKEVTFLLHGSFKETYRGHGTDRALVAGILGMEPSDDRLRNAIELAEKEGIAITFQPSDLGQVHPNTVKSLLRTVMVSNGKSLVLPLVAD